MATGDLDKTKPLESLNWDSASAAASVAAVVNFAMGEAHGAIDWYLKAKRFKQISARTLRFAAIIFAALAGILPMLAQMKLFTMKIETASVPLIEPVWASVLLAIAAALVALDRFFGFSSAWIRYISTELQLRQELQEFMMDWEAERASWKNAPPSDERVQKTLGRCKAFVTQVNSIVRDETGLWIAEFQDTLKQLDEAVKANAAATALGGVAVTVTNGDQCDPPGWTLSIDDGMGETHSGKTAARTHLPPGLRHVKIEGKINTQVKRAESAVTVAAGTVGAVELTLT